MSSKKTYQVCNWRDYNKNLVSRGGVDLWICPKVIKEWHFQGKRAHGGVKKYSDLAIKACLLIREVYQLSFRQCEGFLRSICFMMGIKEVPSYTTLCRRMKTMTLDLKKRMNKRKNIHLLLDSTGLKIKGQGEWFRKKHGKRKFSLWAKLHLAMDHESQQILAVERSGAFGYDSKFLPTLLNNIKEGVSCIYGDGAYDKRLCYDYAYTIGAHLIAPIQKNAAKQTWSKQHRDYAKMLDRDRKVDFLRPFEDREAGMVLWKQVSGYHKRSLVETCMFRLKHYFGSKLSCRNEASQEMQMQLRAYALNKMTSLGMPISIAK